MKSAEHDCELIGDNTNNPNIEQSNLISKCEEVEFIFRPLPLSSRESIQQAFIRRWMRVWDAFYGYDVQNYLEIMRHLPSLLVTEWEEGSAGNPLIYWKTVFYEDGVYPWLKSWFALQAEPTGEPVQPYRDSARRIKIRFELAELIFNHEDPRLNLGWNSSSDGWGPVLFSSPGHLGFWSEMAQCRQWLINKNVTQFPGVARDPMRQGKKSVIKQLSTPQRVRHQLKDWNELLLKLPNVIENTAAEMVNNRSRFGHFEGKERVKALLMEIDEIKLRKAQQVDRSEDFQIPWVEPDGQLFVTRKGVNIPKPGKGFSNSNLKKNKLSK